MRPLSMFLLDATADFNRQEAVPPPSSSQSATAEAQRATSSAASVVKPVSERSRANQRRPARSRPDEHSRARRADTTSGGAIGERGTIHPPGAPPPPARPPAGRPP